jgi:hypothetical protein
VILLFAQPFQQADPPYQVAQAVDEVMGLIVMSINTNLVCKCRIKNHDWHK